MNVDFLIIISPFVVFRYNRIFNVYYVDTVIVIEIPSLSRRPAKWIKKTFDGVFCYKQITTFY